METKILCTQTIMMKDVFYKHGERSNYLCFPNIFNLILFLLTILYAYILNFGNFQSFSIPSFSPPLSPAEVLLFTNRLNVPPTWRVCICVFMNMCPTEFNYGCFHEHEWDYLLEHRQVIIGYTAKGKNTLSPRTDYLTMVPLLRTLPHRWLKSSRPNLV